MIRTTGLLSTVVASLNEPNQTVQTHPPNGVEQDDQVQTHRNSLDQHVRLVPPLAHTPPSVHRASLQHQLRELILISLPRRNLLALLHCLRHGNRLKSNLLKMWQMWRRNMVEIHVVGDMPQLRNFSDYHTDTTESIQRMNALCPRP